MRHVRARPRGTAGTCRMRLKSRLRAFQCSIAGRISIRSARPTISSTVLKPSSAMCSRTSCATKRMKFTTCAGSPAKRSRSSGSCVAIPTGHVLRWQTRIITQPERHERRRGEPELLGPQERADHDIAARS